MGTEGRTMNNLTPEEREVGRDNYYGAVTAYEDINRRDFLVKSIAAGGIAAAGVRANVLWIPTTQSTDPGGRHRNR